MKVEKRKVDNKIDQWGLDRGIIQNGNPIAQLSKTVEEVAETLAALSANDKPAVKDGLGDIYVTLRMVAGCYGISLEECIELAYDEIKHRKGYLREDGVFIKDMEQVIDHPNQTYMDFTENN